MVPFLQFVYLPEEDRYEEISKVPRARRPPTSPARRCATIT
jgi:hypothetical protein